MKFTKDLGFKAKDLDIKTKAKDLEIKTKAKDLEFKAKAKDLSQNQNNHQICIHSRKNLKYKCYQFIFEFAFVCC